MTTLTTTPTTTDPTVTHSRTTDSRTTDSTTTDSTTTGAGAAGPPIDLYREVHKGLRLALSDLTREAGSLDATDAEAATAFASLFADIDMMLVVHHGHEDGGHLGELIARHVDADVLVSIHDAHDRFDEMLDDLRRTVAALVTGDADIDTDTGRLYDDIVAFVAAYLIHMNVEEQEVMPALCAGVEHDELFGVTMEIRTSVPPPEMCVFLRYMLPAMTPDERVGTLGGMKAGAPPEIFDMFWAVAERSLHADALAVVADRIAP